MKKRPGLAHFKKNVRFHSVLSLACLLARRHFNERHLVKHQNITMAKKHQKGVKAMVGSGQHDWLQFQRSKFDLSRSLQF